MSTCGSLFYGLQDRVIQIKDCVILLSNAKVSCLEYHIQNFQSDTAAASTF